MQPVAKTSEPRLSPLSTSGELNAILAPTGWSLMDVTVNTETGFARVVAERRDHSAGTGIKVTLLRSGHTTKDDNAIVGQLADTAFRQLAATIA